MRRCAQGMIVLVVGQLFAVAAVATDNSAPVNYMLHCQGCHLPGGIGHPGIVPNMRNQVGAVFAVSRRPRLPSSSSRGGPIES